MEGNGYGRIKVLSKLCFEGLRKFTRNLSYDSQCPKQNSNRTPPEYKSKALPLHNPALYNLLPLEFQ
jgi:hypothetical protein